ncbi:hypothetical protein [Gracilibacillus kekensis]|uniref:Uncharacterized protein n=1 Tax=Gracilibacillus kekensis TaxID=1027249 RepID=A0A1M7P2N4_9BACI|nr:hypothetical protein [Gracilibacillus kekensis]SHN10758.1 hypothetical protein SAMN05216179_1929 [Gracilibacillus kekensis]
MLSRATLLKCIFILSGLSVIVFGLLLEKGLTAFALFALSIIMAGFVMKPKQGDQK